MSTMICSLGQWNDLNLLVSLSKKTRLPQKCSQIFMKQALMSGLRHIETPY